MSISGRYASGRVNVDDGYSACLSNVPVVIKRFHHGEWHWVTTTSTKSDGSYKALIGGKNGGYKAKAKKITLVNGAICQGRSVGHRASLNEARLSAGEERRWRQRDVKAKPSGESNAPTSGWCRCRKDRVRRSSFAADPGPDGGASR